MIPGLKKPVSVNMVKKYYLIIAITITKFVFIINKGKQVAVDLFENIIISRKFIIQFHHILNIQELRFFLTLLYCQ